MPIEAELVDAALLLDQEIPHWAAVTSWKPVERLPIMQATDLPEDALEAPSGR